jgi:hypothetical protein
MEKSIDINKLKVGMKVETIDGLKGEIVYMSHIVPCNIYLKMPTAYQNEWCYTKHEFIKEWDNGHFKQVGDYVFREDNKTPTISMNYGKEWI